jgi:hypothetical protein
MEGIAELQRDEFRLYLEKSGILAHLTRVLVDLYEEPQRPDNPLDYVRMFLGAPRDIDIEALKAENDELRYRCEEHEATIDALMTQLEGLRTQLTEH